MDIETPIEDMPETPPESMEESEAPTAPVDMELSEKVNLAAAMTEEELKKLGGKRLDKYIADVASRAEYIKKNQKLQKMYALVSEVSNFPYQNAANVKTPGLTGPHLQIQARLYDMIWPASGKVFYSIPATSQDLPVAHITEQFGNSYVRYKMPYMSQGIDDTIHQTCLYGSGFRRTYWDGYEKKVRSDFVSIDDFVVAYGHRSQDPSMSDVPVYTMVHHLSIADIETYGDEKIFINTKDIRKSPNDTQATEFRERAQKIDGIAPDDEDEDAPRKVLEQHCRVKLPNAPQRHPAFDGKQHYVVVTIDAGSEKVLRISLREEDDPDDKRRFDRDMAKYQEYQSALMTHHAAMQSFEEQTAQHQHQAMLQMMPDMAGPDGVSLMPTPEPPQPPGPPPDAVPQPSPIRRKQICFFTHYKCFPSDGFYGLGYGDLLYGLTLATNTMVNQHIHGVTFRNSKPMFMSRQVRMQRGAVNVQPGEVVEIDGPVNQIKDAIMFLDPPMNDPTTVPLIKMLDGMKDVLAGSADLMSGNAPGSNQTKAGMQILNDQLMMPITVLARRMREAFRHDLDKIWRCWGVFLEDEDIADIVTDTGLPQQVQIGRWMFSPTARLVPAADPRIKSQRVEDHMALFQYVMNDPFIQQNPQAAPPIMRALTEEGFRIFPGGEKLIPLLPAPPQQQPEPPPAKPQYEENAGFLNGQDSGVHPDDNDDEHIYDLQAFLQSQPAQVMDKPGRDMAERHWRAHEAQKIMKRGRAFHGQQQQGALPGPGAEGLGPMAVPSGEQAPAPMA